MIDEHLEPPDEEYENWMHEEGRNIESMCEDVLGAFNALYVTGDAFALESCLDQLCWHLDMKTPKGDPIMEKKDPRAAL